MKNLFFLLFIFSFIFSSSFANEERPPQKGDYKVLIFYGNIGSGHLSAAKAIKKALENHVKEHSFRSPVHAKIVNARDFAEGLSSDFVADKVYPFLFNEMPVLYDYIHRGIMLHASTLPTLADNPYRDDFDPEKLLRAIKDYDPHVIISTFFGITDFLGALRENKGGRYNKLLRIYNINKVPISWVHTDYFEGYYSAISKHIDMTFLPAEYLVDIWKNKSAQPRNVVYTGLPIDLSALKKPKDPKEALKLRNNLENFIPQSKLKNKWSKQDTPYTTIFYVSGGDGPRKYKQVVDEVLGNTQKINQKVRFPDTPIELVVVCAKNERCKTDLDSYIKESKVPSPHKLIATGLLKNLPSYLKHLADIYITKPGALSTNEAFALQLPTILLLLTRAQELDNALFYQKLNLAIIADAIKYLPSSIERLITDDELVQSMRNNQTKFSNEINIQKIVDYILDPPSHSEPNQFNLVSNTSHEPALRSGHRLSTNLLLLNNLEFFIDFPLLGSIPKKALKVVRIQDQVFYEKERGKKSFIKRNVKDFFKKDVTQKSNFMGIKIFGLSEKRIQELMEKNHRNQNLQEELSLALFEDKNDLSKLWKSRNNPYKNLMTLIKRLQENENLTLEIVHYRRTKKNEWIRTRTPLNLFNISLRAKAYCKDLENILGSICPIK